VKRSLDRDVLGLATRKAKTGETAANRVHAHLSMVVAYGVEADWQPANPAAGLRRRRESPRTRVLGDEDVRTLWKTLDAATPIAHSRGAAPETRITMPADPGASVGCQPGRAVRPQFRRLHAPGLGRYAASCASPDATRVRISEGFRGCSAGLRLRREMRQGGVKLQAHTTRATARVALGAQSAV
jgi:hypothetical protein